MAGKDSKFNPLSECDFQDEKKMVQQARDSDTSIFMSSCGGYSSSASSSSSSSSSCCFRNLSMVIASLALLTSCVSLVFVIFLYDTAPSIRDFRQKAYGTFTVDLNNTRRCKKIMGQSQLPCKQNMKFITDGDRVGPLRCHDDSNEKEGFACKKSKFKIHFDGKGVVMPYSGVYSVSAIVTFYDKIDRYTVASLRIDKHDSPNCKGSHTCQQLKNKAAHTWLTCFNHNQRQQAAGGKSDFTACSMTGIRPFTAGDVLSLQIPEKYRSINAFYKASYIVISAL